jgi:hypothetical protein
MQYEWPEPWRGAVPGAPGGRLAAAARLAFGDIRVNVRDEVCGGEGYAHAESEGEDGAECGGAHG